MRSQSSFSGLWHRFDESLELYRSDRTPLLWKILLHLLFWWLQWRIGLGTETWWQYSRNGTYQSDPKHRFQCLILMSVSVWLSVRLKERESGCVCDGDAGQQGCSDQSTEFEVYHSSAMCGQFRLFVSEEMPQLLKTQARFLCLARYLLIKVNSFSPWMCKETWIQLWRQKNGSPATMELHGWCWDYQHCFSTLRPVEHEN